jgi:hypothetical protein
MEMVDRADQSDRALRSNDKPENCYCSALPKGSGLCVPCYTIWLAAGARKKNGLALPGHGPHRVAAPT